MTLLLPRAFGMELDTAEVEKAKRVVDKRRGELLRPDAPHGGDRKSNQYQSPSVDLDIPPASKRRYRLFAKWWKPVIYP